MSRDGRLKLLVGRVVREVGHQWTDYGEPLSLAACSSKFTEQLRRAAGFTWSIATFCEHLDALGLLKVVRVRTGKRWVYLRDVWDAMGPEGQAQARTHLEDKLDPFQDRADRRRASIRGG